MEKNDTLYTRKAAVISGFEKFFGREQRGKMTVPGYKDREEKA